MGSCIFFILKQHIYQAYAAAGSQLKVNYSQLSYWSLISCFLPVKSTCT